MTNAANHEKDLAWLRVARRRVDVDVLDRHADFAMLAVQGPRARAIVGGLSDGQLPPRMHVCERTVAGAAMLVCGTGYTGEDGVELLVGPDDAISVWDAITHAGAVPVGLGARDTLRLEVCFHLYGNDLSEGRGPIEAGLGWCCKESTGFIGSEPIATARREGTAEKLVPFAIEGQGIARQGNPVIGGGEVTSGTFSPCLERGIGMAYVSSATCRRGHADRDRRARPGPPRRDHAQTSVQKGSVRTDMADPSYPDDLKYHPEHDWARIDGDTATFGITWYAQDALGEVVFYDAPDVGAEIAKDQPYTEVESVKAVSDVFAPLSGEVTAVNEALADKPETINEDPYGEGWLVKVKLSDPSEVDSLMDSTEYQASLD